MQYHVTHSVILMGVNSSTFLYPNYKQIAINYIWLGSVRNETFWWWKFYIPKCWYDFMTKIQYYRGIFFNNYHVCRFSHNKYFHMNTVNPWYRMRTRCALWSLHICWWATTSRMKNYQYFRLTIYCGPTKYHISCIKTMIRFKFWPDFWTFKNHCSLMGFWCA